LIVSYQIIGLCWIAFFGAWAVLAMVFGGSRKRHPPTAWGARVLFVIAIFAAMNYGATHGLHIPFPGLDGIGGTPAAAAGAALCVAGVAFGIWARVVLGRNWGMPMTLHEDPQLVTSGPYRYVRHPIYTAVATMWIGTSLAYPLGVLPTVLLIAYLVFSALREERDMQKRFPEAYPAYKKRSKMLVPFLI
jgi:protein-S-isoprenylcysteine O-methyltransferase Ste14